MGVPGADNERLKQELDKSTDRAASLDSTDPVAWLQRSMALQSPGRWDATIEANSNAINLEPDNPSSYAERAGLMNRWDVLPKH
jgi:hypothetical protein